MQEPDNSLSPRPSRPSAIQQNYPDETFADELIEEVAAFPNGEYDDLVDSMTQALMRYRQGNFVELPTDDWGEEKESYRVPAYYG